MVSQKRIRPVFLLTLAALLLSLTCIGGAEASELTATRPCPKVFRFDADDFSNPTQIDNPWLPLVPGTQLVLLGESNRGGGGRPHRVVFTVTDLTKVIDGVRTLVMWDRDFHDGQLIERELAFFAQDDEGNVWNLGEYPEEFEDGEFVGAPSTWIAGLAGAQGGIHMRAKPRLGERRYLQGWVPDIEFLDCAKVIQRGLDICVPFNCYDNVLLTDEVSPLDRAGGHQRKYHAPGVGIVQVGAVGDPEGETLALVRIVRLSPGALAEVRAEACTLDKRAHRFSDVYHDTPAAEYNGQPCTPLDN
jgi:hypothetical protein